MTQTDCKQLEMDYMHHRKESKLRPKAEVEDILARLTLATYQQGDNIHCIAETWSGITYSQLAAAVRKHLPMSPEDLHNEDNEDSADEEL